MDTNYYKRSKELFDSFNQLNNTVVRSASLFFKIFNERHATVNLIKDHVMRKDAVAFDSEVISKLEWCVRNERRVLDIITPHLKKTNQFVSTRFPSLVHYLKEDLKNDSLDKRQLRLARRLISQSNVVVDLFNLFVANVHKIELRLSKEEEFLKHKSSGSLSMLFKLWSEELHLAKQFESKYLSLRRLLQDIRDSPFKRVMGSLAVGMGFFVLFNKGDPVEPLPGMPSETFFGWLALASSVVALYNVVLLFRTPLAEEKKDAKLLKRLSKINFHH